jgi:hypothetical protein
MTILKSSNPDSDCYRSGFGFGNGNGNGNGFGNGFGSGNGFGALYESTSQLHHFFTTEIIKSSH